MDSFDIDALVNGIMVVSRKLSNSRCVPMCVCVRVFVCVCVSVSVACGTMCDCVFATYLFRNISMFVYFL